MFSTSGVSKELRERATREIFRKLKRHGRRVLQTRGYAKELFSIAWRVATDYNGTLAKKYQGCSHFPETILKAIKDADRDHLVYLFTGIIDWRHGVSRKTAEKIVDEFILKKKHKKK